VKVPESRDPAVSDRDTADAENDSGSGAVHAVEQLADSLDRMVPISEDPGNRVMVDNARLVRWAAPLFVICAIVLLPWILIAGLTLPQRSLSENYDIAWAGYDVLLLVGLAGTAYTALRRAPSLPIFASATGALLAADAWFDVLTSPAGWELTQAIAMSVLAELPLSFICFWLARHSQAVAERRLVLLMSRRPAGRRAAAAAVGVGVGATDSGALGATDSGALGAGSGTRTADRGK
jgi:hypothetical protein